MADKQQEAEDIPASKEGDGKINAKQQELELNRRKRSCKRNATKIRHQLEKLLCDTSEVEEIERHVDQLWASLEDAQTLMDDLSGFYLDQRDYASSKVVMKESEEFELECTEAIEKAHTTMTSSGQKTKQNNTPPVIQLGSPAKSVISGNALEEASRSENPTGVSASNQRLKPLKVPTFDGDKTKFEEYWALFQSLVDQSAEAVNLKMARLRQSLTGVALEAIRGLGVSTPEYNEAKEILESKFGGQRRQLRAYLDELEELPALRSTDVRGFERFADLVRVTVVKLQAEGRDGELGEGTLHSMLVKKLADKQVEDYSRCLREHSREQSVLGLRDWLKEEVRVRVEAVEMSHGVQTKKFAEASGVKAKHVQGYRGNSRVMFGVRGEQVREVSAQEGMSKGVGARPKATCVCCAGNHGVWSCREFQGLSIHERWNFAKDKQLCFRCLSKDHRGKDCRRSQPCNVGGCQLNHHCLLHRSTSTTQRSAPPESPHASPREGVHWSNTVSMMTQNTKTYSEPCSLRTVPVWLKANGKKVKVNAILDDASNETFLNEEIASLLGLTEPYQKVKVHVLNNTVETFQSMPIKIEIESTNGEYSKQVEVKTCPHHVTGAYKVQDWAEKKSQWSHLEQCDFPKPAKNGFVDFLIGVDNADLHYSIADVRGKSGGPIARLGPLGWTCIGTTGEHTAAGIRAHVIHSFVTMDARQDYNIHECCDVNSTLKKFWEVESYGTETKRTMVMTKDEKIALQKVETSMEHTGERYQISVPWKDDSPSLPDNRKLALKRLEHTEKKLNKDSFVKEQYGNTIKAYEEKGYIRKVSPLVKSPAGWYLAHFPIVRMDKSTTKVRIVFDCSAKYDGISLNDVIHAGPKLQTELFDVLIRFRRNPIGVVCDIKEMFLQIQIEEKDRPYFRILWRDCKDNREPDEYEFTRVVFGKNSAPMEAQFIAQENARRHQDRYPLAAETVLKSTYMDDSIDSVEDEEQGVQLYKELQELWGIAGMQARKWVSNSKQVIACIPPEHRATEIVINEGQEPITKTLGISWNSIEDNLTISITTASPKLQVTKRNVLKIIASIFDPLGMISPVVIVGKILLQVLWSRGYSWDDVIQDETSTEIETWLVQLTKIKEVKIPRCVRNAQPISSFKIITFVDASTSAYGAAVYARYEYEQRDAVTCRLLASKSRVAPLTTITVPRLELMAAVLGLRLTQTLIRVLEVSMQNVAFYSDSLDVLWWIRGHGKDFRPFVANRVGEIQMFSDPAQWQHVPTDQNPADLVSRGVSAVELTKHSLWWNGPEWLQEDESLDGLD